ncbi:MAG: preprotein translocase subunit SecG [Candidatus Babeliales bacterium]
MLYGLLVTLYIFVSIFLMLIVMIQKGKGSMGLGGLGGGTQLLFGGSGGQDIFQKITWILGAIFIGGSLMLSLMKSRESRTLKYIKKGVATQQPAQQQPIIPLNKIEK